MQRLFALLVVTLLASTAVAGTVFDLSPTNRTFIAGPDFGTGQGVFVVNTTAITDMAFYLYMPYGGDLKFMIWEDTNSSLSFSTVLSGVGASVTPSWASPTPFFFTLQSGHEYWFGIIADSYVFNGGIAPPFGYSTGDLTADIRGNSAYAGFANPVFIGNGSEEFGLQLSGGTTTPEPSSLLLLGSGVLGLAGIVRRKINQ